MVDTVGGATGGGGVGGATDGGGGSQGLGSMSTTDITKMSDSDFSKAASSSNIKELSSALSTPNLSDEKSAIALKALQEKLDSMPASTPKPEEGDFGDDTPEEKLKKLLKKLSDKLSHGEKLTAEDKQDLSQAVKAVADSQSSQGASASATK